MSIFKLLICIFKLLSERLPWEVYDIYAAIKCMTKEISSHGFQFWMVLFFFFISVITTTKLFVAIISILWWLWRFFFKHFFNICIASCPCPFLYLLQTICLVLFIHWRVLVLNSTICPFSFWFLLFLTLESSYNLVI